MMHQVEKFKKEYCSPVMTAIVMNHEGDLLSGSYNDDLVKVRFDDEPDDE